MTKQEVKQQLSKLRKEMRQLNIKTVSCFNGGLSPEEYRYNSELFRLKVELQKVSGEQS